MSAAEVRSAFLEFFRAHNHMIVPSSSLVPGNDPTLLFTNSGMVQFKDVFLGREQREYLRAASSQRCVRAGGKHNDLENVGYTARHHTFFEMLGNFSFGDYFKSEAIHFAWDFLIYTLGLDPERLWCTVYRDDDEAADIWLNDIGVSPQRFARLGEASNFWAMGDTGPCGPCSEIFYDHGPGIAGGPPGSAEEEGDRYVEIWNLVFTQFERAADGKLKPLPRPSVDTGMGLERISAVMQGVHSNYDIDLFKNLIRAAGELAGTSVLTSSSLRVIADHIRASTFLVVDGVLPSNEGRGYVLRRIIRRALRHGYKLGIQEPFFYKLVEVLEAEMGDAYPELTRGRAHAQRVLQQEEERFAETLANGMVLLEGAIRNLQGAKVIDGDTVFKLYDTFGFPVDLTADVARERGLEIDQTRFEAAMEEQRRRSQEASKFGADLGGGASFEARRSTRSAPVSRVRSCSTALRSTPRRAVRWGMRASSPVPVCASWWKTRTSAAPRMRTRVASSRAAFVSATRSRRKWTAPGARRLCSITVPHICCTRRCARYWAATYSRRDRWSRPTGCASISGISSRSPPRNCARSNGS